MFHKKRIKKPIAALLCALAVIMTCFGSVSAMYSSSLPDTGAIAVTVDTGSDRRMISPYIYGINAETPLSGVTVNALRQSDPRLSSYNWETNYSNSASGKDSTNDNLLVRAYTADRQREPALYTDNLVSKANRFGIPSKYVTLQMMGAVAADADGTVRETDGGERWKQVFFSKHDGLLYEPETADDAVYMDEYVSFLANKYGYAVDGGINGYFLDSEPENWSELYPYAAAERITADELISRSAQLAESVKSIDPTALVYGPSVNGIEAFINLKNPSDWEKHAHEYSWFIDYYLKGMRSASEKAGMRLLDVLDIHYYTEATNGLLEPIISSSDNFSNSTRLQAPRILWDSTYTENSTAAILHNQHIPLIPTLDASISMYYPGTKLSFSEYSFGGGDNVSGGIAVADALGIFASYGIHMACLRSDAENSEYQKSGINIYTDYDGDGGSFGSTMVKSEFKLYNEETGVSDGDDIMSSVYASIDGSTEKSLKMLMINKNGSFSKKAYVTINSGAVFESADVYSFGSESPDIVLSDETITVEDNSFEFEMEPLTVYMLAFSGAEETLEVTGPDETTVQGGSSDVTLTEISGESVTSVTATHEHVDAETYSSAGTTPAETEETGIPEVTEKPVTDSVTAVPDETVSAVTETSAAEENGDNEEKSVPKAVKTAVCVLVAAVVLAMAYIVIDDRIMSAKRKK